MLDAKAFNRGPRHATAGALFRLWVGWRDDQPGWWDHWMGGNACDGDTRGENVVNQLELRRGTGLMPTCPACLALWAEALAQADARDPDDGFLGDAAAFMPQVGRLYRNLKTSDLYRVKLITRDSETKGLRVVYELAGGPWPASWEPRSDVIPWDRPLDVFVEKFREAPATEEG